MVELVSIPERKDECPFEEGDRVALFSGGVVMTVVATHPPPKDGMPWAITGAWHDDVGCEHEASYPVTAVREWSEEEETAEPAPKPRKRYRRKQKLGKDFEIAFTPWKGK